VACSWRKRRELLVALSLHRKRGSSRADQDVTAASQSDGPAETNPMPSDLTIPDLPSFLKLIAAARECMELSAAPLKYRQRIVSELRNIEKICRLPQPEMKR